MQMLKGAGKGEGRGLGGIHEGKDLGPLAGGPADFSSNPILLQTCFLSLNFLSHRSGQCLQSRIDMEWEEHRGLLFSKVLEAVSCVRGP